VILGAIFLSQVELQQGKGSVAKSIHSMIRVLDEDRSVDFYQKAFGLAVAERLDFETFILVYMSNVESEFELELTINKGRTEAYNLGDGYGHFAVSVSDLDGEHARISALRFSTGKIVEFNRDGGLLARFFFVTDPDGYKIEVLQRHGRYK
jgi:lactoylglutathione lyase